MKKAGKPSMTAERGCAGTLQCCSILALFSTVVDVLAGVGGRNVRVGLANPLAAHELIMDTRSVFFETLKREFSPTLRELGYRGSGQHFRRLSGEIIHAVNVQGARHGGKAALNIGIHATFLPAVPYDTLPDPKRIKEIECEFRKRVTPNGEDDYWWEFSKSVDDAQRSAQHLIHTYLAAGEPFLQQVTTAEDLATLLPLELIRRGECVKVFDGITATRAALAMARVHRHLGNDSLAKAFAIEGLAQVGRAKGLIPRFHEILNGK